MRIVVPLAGPDFIRPDGGLKARVEVNGQPLLRSALGSRAWASSVAPSDYVFILIDDPRTRAFEATDLEDWFPGARSVFLSNHTAGAALSAAAGVALAAEYSSEPLIVDLADIFYNCPVDPLDAMSHDVNCGGVALVFESDDPSYSYLRTGPDGRFLEAAEKRVISGNASAGTYIFSNSGVYFGALAYALARPEAHTHRGVFFVCPLFNGVKQQGLDVKLQTVTSVVDIKQAMISRP